MSNFENSNKIDLLKAATPKHPALQRVVDKLRGEQDSSTVVTNYDRMHHRHNRS